MATHHRISSDHDRYQSVVKAKEMRSLKQGHSHTHAERREEDATHGAKRYDSFDKGFKLIQVDSRTHPLRGEAGEHHHKHGEIKDHDHDKRFDRHDFAGRNAHRHDRERFFHGKPHIGLLEIHKGFPEPVQSVQVTRVTYTPSAAFSGLHLGSRDKIADAHKNFLSAALGYLENPNKDTYKALTESMTKLLDPRFTPAVSGGAVKVQVRNVNGNLMAKFTMDVTPAPTKTLDEAREDLKNAFSSKRNGEKGIDKIREEAHANYIRALSEKFKNEGVISHTNHTPTTPVFKSSVIYIVKVTQIHSPRMLEIKQPDFRHNLKGKLNVKGHHDFWNGYRNNHKSYVDLLRHDSKKVQIDHDFKSGKNHEAKHSHRNFEEFRTDRTHHKPHAGIRTHRN